MKPLDAFLETHKHPVNRACHALAALSGAAAAPALFFRWRAGLALGALAGLLLAAGHLAEGVPPAVLQKRKK